MSAYDNILKAFEEPTVNHAGGPAWAMTPEMELFTSCACCAMADKFYETSEDNLRRIASLVANCHPEYVALRLL